MNLPDGTISLSTLDSTLHWTPIGTATVEHGHFEFAKGLPASKECAILSIGNQNIVVFLDESSIQMSGNALRPEDIKVSGSDLNDKLVDFTRGIPGKERLSQIQALLGTTANNIDEREELKEEMRTIEKTQVEYIRKSILDNANSPVGPFILFNYMGLFTYEEALAFERTFTECIPGHKYVSYLGIELAKHEELNEIRKRVEIGKTAPDFGLPNAEGDTIWLKSLRGDVVLIDFWELDDEMSQKNNEIVSETYKKFADKGFTVINVAISADIAKWKETIKAENLAGNQVIDEKGEIARLFAVDKIPASYLIDENGEIVSKDVDNKNIFADIEQRMARNKASKTKK